jgi:hypothetical protein
MNMTLIKTYPMLAIHESLALTARRPPLNPPGFTTLRLQPRLHAKEQTETSSTTALPLISQSDPMETGLFMALSAGVLVGLGIGWMAAASFMANWSSFASLVQNVFS